MNGQKLLNNTLRVNAVFSLLSGMDFILFDQRISSILSEKDLGSLSLIGVMLISFSVLVFMVSMFEQVNKYVVGTIILMDGMWVLGSVLLVATSASVFTIIGLALISLTALIITVFALLQTLGLTSYLKSQTA